MDIAKFYDRRSSETVPANDSSESESEHGENCEGKLAMGLECFNKKHEN